MATVSLPTETIVLCVVADKTTKSYQYAKDGKPGNPTSIHPKNFESMRGFKMPVGSSGMLRRMDPDTIGELINMAHAAGMDGITVQVRRAAGGVGNGKSTALKIKIKTGQIDTRETGFPVLIEELEL